MAVSDGANRTSLGELLEELNDMGFLFRTQGVDSDEYVPADEIASDLRHGDMAEMLTWSASWDSHTLTIYVMAPNDAVEAPSATIEIHAQHVL